MHDRSILSQVEHAFAFAQQQLRAMLQRHPHLYPMYTDSGRWCHSKPAWTRWCDGFLPGMMWIFYEETNDLRWRELAQEYSRALEPRKDDQEVHDLGFIFYHGTYKRWYEATVRQGRPDQALKDVVIRAGQVLALRFKPNGQYLRSFISDESLFIEQSVGREEYFSMDVPDPAVLEQGRGDEKPMVGRLLDERDDDR